MRVHGHRVIGVLGCREGEGVQNFSNSIVGVWWWRGGGVSGWRDVQGCSGVGTKECRSEGM